MIRLNAQPINADISRGEEFAAEFSPELSAEFSAALDILKDQQRVVRVIDNEKVVAQIVPVNDQITQPEDSSQGPYKTWGESLRDFRPSASKK